MALLALASTAACGSTAPGGAGARGHLHIVATIGPTCPVERAGEPPCVAPYHGELDVSDNAGSQIARVTTTAAGTADISLPPGTFTISAPASQTGLPRLIQPATVTVTAGGSATAHLQFDTGIR